MNLKQLCHPHLILSGYLMNLKQLCHPHLILSGYLMKMWGSKCVAQNACSG